MSSLYRELEKDIRYKEDGITNVAIIIVLLTPFCNIRSVNKNNLKISSKLFF
jgi:hypothetical protein